MIGLKRSTQSHAKPTWHSLGVIVVRSVFLIILLTSIDALVDIGSPLGLLIVSGILGILAANKLKSTSLTNRGFGLVLVALAVFYFLLRFLARELYPFFSSSDFSPYVTEEHITLGVILFLIGLGSSFAFWRIRGVITLKIIGLSLFFIYLLSGHRNYRLDSPQFLNSLAWSLGVDPQTILIGAGCTLLSAVLGYLMISEFSRVKSGEKKRRRWLLSTALSFGIIAILLLGVSKLIYSSYDLQKGLTTNGVGEASESGNSPLGFHSALGSTNQPAALVRLEGDYSKNPFSPMLYMRESALSKFNGRELVIAERSFDTDVSRTHPLEPYFGMEDQGLIGRVALNQSIYLLSDQKDAFAVDYPISIKQLKNPDPAKFRGSYRAYSLAPTFTLEEIGTEQVGDPRWSAATSKHYLELHPDKRYENLALELTYEAPAPVQKAFALVDYLSQTAIYTLRPNHDVKPDQDPVAPFLFGDNRGYCVHFAHSLVYMLRALGIPSRIGTGYLTDLSQAKDGHILLRMSDRHAWAEVYVTTKGWVPFDPKPEQVESAAETEVDMKLLEELMGALEPGEEILPKDILKDEEGVEEPLRFPLPGKLEVILGITIFFLLILCAKLWLRFGWLVTRDPSERLRRSYIALASKLSDLGHYRESGETRREYETRICKALGLSSLSTTSLLLSSVYGSKNALNVDQVDAARLKDQVEFSKVHKFKQILGFINPSSIFARFGGSPW